MKERKQLRKIVQAGDQDQLTDMINSSVYTEDDELQLRLNEELLKTLDSKDNIPNSL